MSRPLVGLVLGVFLLAGCSSPQEDDGGLAGPPQIAFDGKLDDKLAGTWRSANGDSILDMAQDGSLKIESNFNTPNGRRQSTKVGKWLVSQESLKLQYQETDGSLQTIAYLLKQTGDTMVLSTKSPKLETTYKRSK